MRGVPSLLGVALACWKSECWCAVCRQGSAVAKQYKGYLGKHSSSRKPSLKGPRLAMPQKTPSAVVEARVLDRQAAPLAETSDGEKPTHIATSPD